MLRGPAPGYGGDDGPTNAELNEPREVAVTADDEFLIADAGNDVVRIVALADHSLTKG